MLVVVRYEQRHAFSICLGECLYAHVQNADDITTIGYILPILGESDHSPATLQLKELFSFAEIADLPLQSLSLNEETEYETENPELLEQWTTELAGLTESLFSTLSTTEMVSRQY